MFCPNCGSEIQNGSAFCGKCGAPVVQAAEGFPQREKSKKKLWIALAGAVIAVALFVVFVAGSAVDLKYDWGTSKSEVRENEEIVYEYDLDDFEGYRVCCEDKEHEVDALDAFEIVENEVIYQFDKEDALCCIYYFIEYGYTLEERIDLLNQEYGNDCYVYKGGGRDERYYSYYWWVGDTVIEFRPAECAIEYYSEEYILEVAQNKNHCYYEVKEYFGE